MCTKEGAFNPFQIPVMQEGKIRHSGDKKTKKKKLGMLENSWQLE